MKIGSIPQSLIEWVGLKLELAPRALVDTHIAMLLARTVMAGAELRLFDALARAPLTAEEAAAVCGAAPAGIALLLDALCACGYLHFANGHFALTRRARRWLLSGSSSAVNDKLLLQVIEWRWLEGLESFVRTGQPLEFHDSMSAGERELYHRGMRALAGIAGHEVARRVPLRRGARRMLDLGGSHGHFAAEICRRHPPLSAEVMDLPEAIEVAAPLLAAEDLGERLVHRVGDAATADLGVEQYDLVLMSNLAHHLGAEQNRNLAARVARALKPGGAFVIQEAARSQRSGEAGQMAALLGLYFAMQSRPGARTWTIREMAEWQRSAGLKVRAAKRLRTAPGWVQQSAIRL
ncbi:MAG TPA: class I SAM-dependent methyltransferase [Sphingomicrobium sp.]|nr:class I SAM-dependent methyltransferase [Sphingomicrobium sp.]